MQRAFSVLQILVYDAFGNGTILSGKTTPWSVSCEDYLIQERQTIISVNCQKFAAKVKFDSEEIDTFFKNAVFIIKIWYIGHDKVQIDWLIRFCFFITNVLHNSPQSS